VTRTLFIDPRAEPDIQDLTRYGIVSFGVERAALYYDELLRHFELLAEHPRLGHSFLHEHPFLYSFLFGVHVIAYHFDETSLTVHRVLHSRMNLTMFV
jgi:plasmid stabilization system protein ParE